MGCIKYSKKCLVLFLLLIIVLVGCSQVEKNSPSARVTLSDILKQAYLLESKLWEQPERVTNYEDVVQYYSQGFDKPIARRLAKYTWSSEMNSLRPGDRVMSIPNRVYIVTQSSDTALLYHQTPRVQIQAWDREPFTIVKLKKMNKKWIVVNIDYSNHKPGLE